jgi:hypothetical protein
MDVSGQLHALASLCLRKWPWILIGWEAGHCGEEKSLLLLPEIEPRLSSL